jgi:hypothetical protein
MSGLGTTIVFAGIYPPTGRPTVWNTQGVQMNVPSLDFANGTGVGIGTTDNNPVRLVVNSNAQASVETSGNLFLWTAGAGLILRSPNGTCYDLTVNNSGVVGTAGVTCP